MKRVLPVLGLLLIFLGRAAADEPPYLDFVKGLRDMGYPDLALQYLQKLKAKPPQGITPAELTLESGLTGVEAARLEPDLSKRAAFYAQARTDLEDFLKGNASHPRAAEANLALARLVALQGQTELSKADRDQTAEGKEAQRQKARPLFEQADKLLGQVAGQAADPKAKLQAQMEQASNLFNEARTYNTQKNADLLKRADILKQARGIFETIAANNLKDPIGWEALAWVGRCYQEVDEGDKALQVYNRIFQERGPVSDTGRRLAQYYRMILLDRNPKAIQGDALAEIAKSGESWRAAYPRYLHTPDGYGVTFLTAEALLKQGVQLQEAMKTPKGPLPPKVLDLFARAEKLYGELEGSDNDYADLASQRRLFLVVTRSGQKLEGHDITALTTFTDCFEQARVQLNTMFDEDRNFKGQTDEERKQHQKQHQQHLDQAVALLQRALTLTGTRVTPDQLAQARNLLSYCYIQANKSYQAAVLADFTVHSTDPSLKSAQAAGAYALQAYAQALGDQQTAQAPDEVLNADRRQLRNVADFIQKTWTTEDVADAARHQIGRLLLQEKKYAEAVAVLSRINPSYSSYTYSQLDLSNAALLADKDGLPPPMGQPPYKQIQEEALKKIKDLDPNAPAATVQVYMYGKLKLADLLFANKEFPELQALAAKLATQVDLVKKSSLDDQVKEQLESAVAGLPIYLTVAKAQDAFTAGDFKGVLALLDPLANDYKAEKLPIKDPLFVRGMLGLVLRANVQLGNMDQAKDTLELMKKTIGEFDKGGLTGILVGVVQQLKDQVEDLRKKGPSHQKELDETVSRFSAFLDELAKQQNLSDEVLRFLANGYASLGQHQKAADLLNQIPAPKPPLSPDQEAQYLAVHILFARELRLAGQLDRAKKVLDDMAQTEQGKRSLELKKEQIMLEEDQGNWSQAAKDWDGLMKTIRPMFGQAQRNLNVQPTPEEMKKLEKENSFRDAYFDCYYQFTYCYYKYALTMKDDHLRQQTLEKVAGLIAAVRDKQGEVWKASLKGRYDDLFQKEPLLKSLYDKQSRPAA